MRLSRRSFVRAALGGAALFLPEAVAAEPERRVWAFPANPIGGRGARATFTMTDEAGFLETGWFDSSMPSFDKHITGGTFTLTFDGVPMSGPIAYQDGGVYTLTFGSDDLPFVTYASPPSELTTYSLSTFYVPE